MIKNVLVTSDVQKLSQISHQVETNLLSGRNHHLEVYSILLKKRLPFPEVSIFQNTKAATRCQKLLEDLENRTAALTLWNKERHVLKVDSPRGENSLSLFAIELFSGRDTS